MTGNTELGIEQRFKLSQFPVFISPVNVPELTALNFGEKGVTIGASVTLSTLHEKIETFIHSLPAEKVSIFMKFST